MALQTIRTGMCSGQRECGQTVIKHIICTARGMTGQARGAVVGVAGHAIVVIVRFRIHVAGDTGKLGIVCRVGMTIDAGSPFALMFATENGEVLSVMIEGGRDPARFAVTGCTVCGKHQHTVIGINGLVIVRLMAPGTGGGRVEIISVVTSSTIVGDQCMGAI